MSEFDKAKAQREALDSVAARRAAGSETRYDALRRYLSATLTATVHGKRRSDASKTGEEGPGGPRG
ncbi:MAG TPA: hypothetical protein VEK80_01385 [Kribbellaceae bacterium]|nr:hypothetical protein [Kribbellaceae bacterium]